MFKKQFRVKSNTRLRTTDKKKFRNELIKQLPKIENYFDLEAISLKSNISSMEVVTHSGETILVYCTPQYPTFIYHNNVFFPTVFVLWKCPQLLHTFYTHSFVLEKIRQGADLMLPGVIFKSTVESECYGNFQKGDPLAIVSEDSNMAVACGSAFDSSQILMQTGKRGKCVHVIHFIGDSLSDLATADLTPEQFIQTDSHNNVTEVICSSTKVESSSSLEDTINQLPEILSENVLSDVEKSLSGCSDPFHQDSMEDLLTYCFFKALITTVKKVKLPLLTNVFYKVHMMEVYPNGSMIDIKKSKFKKLSPFLTEMAALGIITLEENNAGVHKIIKIDYSHYLVKEFIKNYPPEEATPPALKCSATPNISEKHTINATVLPLFSKFNFKKGDAVSQSEVRKVITNYVKEEKLQDGADKRFILLDELLKKILNINVKALTWEDIMKTILNIMGQSFEVNLATKKTISGKGKLPLIEMQVCVRAKSKKVTLINNLSFYGINLAEFCKECQHGVAASTTINTFPHMRSEQVQVQGNHINFLGKLLTEKYKVPKRYITGWNN